MKLNQVPTIIDKRITGHEKWIASQYRSALRVTRSQIATIYEKYSVGGKLSYADMAKYHRLTSLEKELVGVFNGAQTVVNTRLKTLPADVFTETFARSAFGVDSMTGTLHSWGLIPKAAIESVAANPLDKIARDSLSKDMRDRIRRVVVQGALQGQSYAEMAKNIKSVYDSTATRATMIARTEGQRAMADAQQFHIARSEKLGIKIRVFWDAYMDNRTRDNHAQMNGVEAKEHNGELMFYYTPTGQWVKGPMDPSLPAEDVINCFAGDNHVSFSRVEKVYRRYYQGKMLRIKTALGTDFTVTVNHPILTPNGWVRANLLYEGCDIFSMNLSNALSTKPKEYTRPVVFAKVYNLFSIVFKVKRMSGGYNQFHGDIGFGDSEVDVISLNGELRNGIYAKIKKKLIKVLLPFSNILQGGLSGNSSFNKLVRFPAATPNSFMSFLGNAHSLFFRRPAHSHIHTLASVSNRDAIFSEYPIKDTSRYPILRSEGLERLSCNIRVDKVVSVRQFDFSGHVYNLQCFDDKYIVTGISNNDNGIIAHNCRCSIRQELADEPAGTGQGISYDEWRSSQGF